MSVTDVRPQGGPPHGAGAMLRTRAAGLALAALGFLAADDALRAGVRWECDVVEAAATTFDDRITVDFPFRNTGTAAVRFVSFSSDCGCTHAGPLTVTYGPGPGHRLRVEFTVGSRTGLQETALAVVTDESPGVTHILRLRVQIEAVAVPTPSRLVWAIGESPGPKTVELVLTRPGETAIGAPRAVSGTFRAIRDPEAPSDRPRLRITPSSTQTAARGVIELPVTVSGRARMLTVFAEVK
jgi:hypothetical protein